MLRRSVLAMLGLLAIAALFLLTPTGQVVSQKVSTVFVTNFPHVQRIEGPVEVVGPIKQSRIVTFENITLPPVPREATTEYVEGGILVTDGFPKVVLSMHGVVKGHVTGSGNVGVLLLPTDETIQEAFREQGILHFYMEAVATNVSVKTPYFASNQPRFTVGFPEYRILYYNTTDKTMTINLFAYLTD